MKVSRRVQGSFRQSADFVAKPRSASRFFEMTDGQVIEAYLAGDERAFGEIMVRYQSRLINFVHHKIHDRDRAEDLVQDAFVRVIMHMRNFDQSKKFSTWIYTIVLNLVRNEIRNRKRNPIVFFHKLETHLESDGMVLQFEDFSHRPDDLFRKRELIDAVERAVDELKPEHRRVFILREFEGRTYEEISEVIGENLGTVKSRLNRARNAFAAFFPEVEMEFYI